MSRPLPAEVVAATGGDREAVRSHIMDRTHRVIVRDGLDGATTRAISAETGLAAGTMYNYFGGRVDLVAAAIVHHGEALASPVAEVAALAGTGTVLGNLQLFMERAAAVLDELLPLFGAAFAEPVLLAELRRRVSRSPGLSDPVAALERYLQAELRLGRIRADADIASASSLIGSMCHDDAFRRHLLGGGIPPRTRDLAFVASSLQRS